MADPNQDPFAAMGGGVRLANGDWVPHNHPLAQQGAAPAPQAPQPGAPGAAVPGQNTTIQQQAQLASTNTTLAGAAPLKPTANAGTQDVVRNSYLEMAAQPRVPSRQDPVIRAQADSFAAQQERSRRNASADAAESMGPYATGALAGQNRMLQERAGITSGAFEAELVNREVQARRQEILAALQGLTGFITEDQRQALSRELAQLNASLEQSRMGQQDRQFADTLGYNIGRDEAEMDDRLIRLILGGA